MEWADSSRLQAEARRIMAELAYAEVGGGSTPILLIHGLFGSRKALVPLAQQLASQHDQLRLLLVDLPGHGDSPPMDDDATLSSLANDVLALLDDIVPSGRVDVVGHSLGGRVALALRQLAPHRVGRTTLLDMGPGRTQGIESLDALVEALADAPDLFTRRADLVDVLTAANISKPVAQALTVSLLRRAPAATPLDQLQFGWSIDRKAVCSFQARVSVDDLWAVVSVAPSEVRCIRGADSDFVTPADVDRLMQLGCQLDVIEGTGHSLHTEKPAEVAALVSAGMTGAKTDQTSARRTQQ